MVDEGTVLSEWVGSRLLLAQPAQGSQQAVRSRVVPSALQKDYFGKGTFLTTKRTLALPKWCVGAIWSNKMTTLDYTFGAQVFHPAKWPRVNFVDVCQ